MQFKGSTRREQERSRELWDNWLRTVRRNSNRAKFAMRFAELIEQRVGSPQPHVTSVAPRAMEEALAQFQTPLSAAHRREVILVLYRCWRHGLSLRNWALGQGYVERDDR